MKAKKFDSFSEYESWTDTFDNAADYQMIPTIVDDGWKVSIDLFIECKKAKTAIRRFISTFSEYFPDVKDWGDGMLESIEAGYWHDDSHGYQNPEEERKIAQTFGAFSWGIEETMEGEWYIFLNVSGEYAGRGARDAAHTETKPATRYMEQVKQADTLDQLDQITEAAAMDEALTGAQYEAVYAAALHKAKTWDARSKGEERATMSTNRGRVFRGPHAGERWEIVRTAPEHYTLTVGGEFWTSADNRRALLDEVEEIDQPQKGATA